MFLHFLTLLFNFLTLPPKLVLSFIFCFHSTLWFKQRKHLKSKSSLCRFSFSPQCYGFKQLLRISGSLCKPSLSDHKYWPFGLPQLLCSCILHLLVLHSSFFRLCYCFKISFFQKHAENQVIFRSSSTFNVNHQFCILFS